MEKNQKKSIIVGIVVLLVVTLILLGITYAYYRTRIIGNPNDESISVTSKKMEVTYHDGTATLSTEGKIEPGFNATKTFSVENTGSEIVNYTIVLDNVTNSFKRTKDWTYTLTNTDTNETTNGTIYQLSEQTILGGISIVGGATNNYKLEINYTNSSEDQSEDMGATLTLRVNIKDASEWDKAIEGTLLYALRENNEVVDTVSNVGESSIHNYKDTRDGMAFNDNQNLDSREYTWKYASGYTYDKNTKKYSLTGVQSGIYNNVYNNLNGKYLVSINAYDYTQGIESLKTDNLNQIYQVSSATDSKLKYYTVTPENMDATSENVLSSAEDDYGMSYYFRGNVKNNFINYSGMCWRIVRVQGNGTIKLVLADPNRTCNDSNFTTETIVDDEMDMFYGTSFITGSNYNSSNSTNVNFEDSEIFSVLNDWLTDNITDTTDLDDKAEWCSDTSYTKRYYDYSEKEIDGSNPDLIANIGYEYGFLNRISNKNASLKCDFIGQENSSTTKIINNIGLLTADEVIFAGNPFNNNLSNSYYLMENTDCSSNPMAQSNWCSYWTMTPLQLGSSMESEELYINTILDSGNLWMVYAGDWGGAFIRPSVVLNSNVTIVSGGTGTQTNPYVIN